MVCNSEIWYGYTWEMNGFLPKESPSRCQGRMGPLKSFKGGMTMLTRSNYPKTMEFQPLSTWQIWAPNLKMIIWRIWGRILDFKGGMTMLTRSNYLETMEFQPFLTWQIWAPTLKMIIWRIWGQILLNKWRIMEGHPRGLLMNLKIV